MSKDKRLGRGLEALLGKVAAAQANAGDANGAFLSDPAQTIVSSTSLSSILDAATNDNASSARSIGAKIEEEKDRALAKFSDGRAALEVDVDLIDRNPYQPRLDFEENELKELRDSIANHGLLQPIALRQNGDRYELIAGERRFRAAKDVGWKKIPALILVVEDRQMAELALTENMQRRDLNPIEKAQAFRNYLDIYGGTHEELAKRLAFDRSTVSNLMRLLDLNDEVQQMTRKGELTMGHARALLPLEELDQLELAKRIVDEQLSVRQTETIVKEFLNGEVPTSISKKGTPRNTANPRVEELEQQFREWLGMKVKLTSNDKGKGKLVVHFSSNEEFERVYQALMPKDI